MDLFEIYLTKCEYIYLIEISRIAHSMYDTDLARKDYSDTIRNALNVIQRYKFIFHLPQTIERSVKRVYRIMKFQHICFCSFRIGRI